MKAAFSYLTQLQDEVIEDLLPLVDELAEEFFGVPLGEEELTGSRKYRAIREEAENLVRTHWIELLPPEWVGPVLAEAQDPAWAMRAQTGPAFQAALASDPERGPAVLRKAQELAIEVARQGLIDAQAGAPTPIPSPPPNPYGVGVPPYALDGAV